MKKLLVVLVVVAMLLGASLNISAQSGTTHTFTLDPQFTYRYTPDGTIRVNLLAAWDGAYPPSQDYPDGYPGQYFHYATSLTDFIFPTVSLFGCSVESSNSSQVFSTVTNPPYADAHYRTTTTTANYACQDAASVPFLVVTTLVNVDKKGPCSGRGQRAGGCWVGVSVNWTGTVTEQ